MHPKILLLFFTTLIMGLTAGIFYCWSVSVTRGLALLPDREYITAFQSLNCAILNPLFFICFMGTAVLLPLSAWMQYRHPFPPQFWLLASAALVYFIGVLGITMAGNVPMNESLDTFDAANAGAADLSTLRSAFEARWNGLNHIRSFSCIICFGLTVLACMIPERG